MQMVLLVRVIRGGKKTALGGYSIERFLGHQQRLISGSFTTALSIRCITEMFLFSFSFIRTNLFAFPVPWILSKSMIFFNCPGSVSIPLARQRLFHAFYQQKDAFRALCIKTVIFLRCVEQSNCMQGGLLNLPKLIIKSVLFRKKKKMSPSVRNLSKFGQLYIFFWIHL